MRGDGTIGWALVGCGWLGRAYAAPAIAASGNGRLVAACDRDADARASVRADFATDDLDAVLARPDVDAVYVATPNDSHASIVERCAAAGRHVLCEKPMARTLADARRMADACRAAGVTYATAFDQRWHPAHVAIRAAIGRGDLGVVTQVLIRYACWTPGDWRPGDWQHDNWRVDAARAGGGAMIDLAPHGLDLTQTLLSEPIARVACLLQSMVHGYDVDDGATIIGQTVGGTLLNLSVAYNCPDAFPRRRLEIVGTAGRVLAENTMGQTPGGTVTLTRPDGRVEPITFDAEASPFTAQARAFADALLGGSPWPFSVEQDLHTMALLDAAASQRMAEVTPPLWHGLPARDSADALRPSWAGSRCHEVLA